jgi:trans-2,3-dihydro-3-hydroxyanthranilate isomerase
MQKLRYHLVDVFTSRAFGGNPLAVFTAGHNVTSTEAMQRIAKELNLSETTFVLPAEDKQNDFKLRIFTPATELPMAGHPTIGTAYVLAQEKFIDAEDDIIHFEEGIGVIPVALEFEDGTPAMITMDQPIPKFGPIIEARDAIAAMLGLQEDDLLEGHPVQLLSNAVPFTYVPLRNLDAIRRFELRIDLWKQHHAEMGVAGIHMFTPQTETQGATVHSRVSALGAGVMEDPATGAASGPLGAYLVAYGLAPKGSPSDMISEQGFEMGRPSFIHISVDHSGDQITRVRVGGRCVAIGEGFIYQDLFG